MLESLLSLDRLAAIAHRGGSKLRPENTLAAFDHAVSLGVDALECDVHLSRDGEAVVIHDATLDRTSDASGPVASRSAAELSRVDAGFRFGADDGFPFRSRGCGVPTLRELLDRYRDRPLIVEIKGDDPAVGRRAVGIIREHGALERVIVGGFSPAVLDAVRREAPGVPTGASRLESRRALTRSYFRLTPSRPAFQVFQMPFRLRGRQMFGRSFVTAARRGRLPVHAWIVDDPGDMARLIAWGVTGIISDRPDLAVDAVKAALTAALS
jgi:glycerophosphoryl diester phosphodiesterase